MNKFIASLKAKNIGVAVTASTGIAATHIGGRTIHSWAGIGIKDNLSSSEIQKLTKRSYLKKQFEKTNVLVIDEVSMLHGHRLDMVDSVCRAFKKNHLPFGGMQIVMSGDFFQLPPISAGSGEAEFIYKAKVWPEMDLRICYLDEQHRQNDKNISEVLKSIRRGAVSPETIRLLEDRMGKQIKSKVRPVRLFTHNTDVDAINSAELKRIDAPEFNYQMTGSGEKKLVDSLKNNCLAPENLVLKKGSLVMFVKNKFNKNKPEEEAIYINGTTGQVIGFDTDNLPIVRLSSGREIVAARDSWTIDDDSQKILAEINQIPLRLAWAITVHKSQGMTLEAAEIDLSKSFGYGMGYVALSRLTNLEGLYLLGINEMAYKLDPQVFEYDKELKRLSELSKADVKPKRQKKQGILM